VRYYRSIEGRNFNDSEEYREKYADGPPAQALRDVPKTPNNVPYFLPGGKPSACFATFSTGGIHGAEADTATYQAELAEYEEHVFLLSLARQAFPDAKDFVAEAKRQHNLLRLPDGTTVDKRQVLL